MLLVRLQQDLTSSLKGGNRDRVETLRFLLSAIRYEAIAKYGAKGEAALTDEDVQGVIKKQVKTHKESVEAFTGAGRIELADKEKAQLAILEAFLPLQLTDEDIKKLLEPVVTSGEKNFGLLMKQAMAAVKGQADGGRVSGILKQLMHY